MNTLLEKETQESFDILVKECIAKNYFFKKGDICGLSHDFLGDLDAETLAYIKCEYRECYNCKAIQNHTK